MPRSQPGGRRGGSYDRLDSSQQPPSARRALFESSSRGGPATSKVYQPRRSVSPFATGSRSASPRAASPRSRSNTAPERRRSSSRSPARSRSPSVGLIAGGLPRADRSPSSTSPGRATRQRARSSPGRRRLSPTYVRGDKHGVRLSPGELFDLPEDITTVKLVGLWSAPSMKPTPRFERTRSDGSLAPIDAELLPHDAEGQPLETTRGSGKQRWADYTQSLRDESFLPARLARQPPQDFGGCPWQWLPHTELKATYGQSSTANVSIELSRMPPAVRFLSFTLIVRRGPIGSQRAPQIQLLEEAASGDEVLCTHVASTLGAAERAGSEIVMCRLWQLLDDVEAGAEEAGVWPRTRNGTPVKLSPGPGYRRVGGGFEKVGARWMLEILDSGRNFRPLDTEHHLTLSPVLPQYDIDDSDMSSLTEAEFDIDYNRSTYGADSWRGREERARREKREAVERKRLEREAARRSRSRSRSRERDLKRLVEDEEESGGRLEVLCIAAATIVIVALFVFAMSAMAERGRPPSPSAISSTGAGAGATPAPSSATEAGQVPEAIGPEVGSSFNVSSLWSTTVDGIGELVHGLGSEMESGDNLPIMTCLDEHPSLVAIVFILSVGGVLLGFCGCFWWCKYRREHIFLDKRLPSFNRYQTPSEIEIEDDWNAAGTRRRRYGCCTLLSVLTVLASVIGLYIVYELGGCTVLPEHDECGLPILYLDEAQQQQTTSPPVIDAFCCPHVDVATGDGTVVGVTAPCAFDPLAPDECSEIMAYASGSVEEPPYPSWQDIAKSGRGQQLCTGSVTIAGGFDRCRYSFEARTPTPSSSGGATAAAPASAGNAAALPSRCGYCTDNTPATEQEDVVCDPGHSVLVENANATRGRDAAACCVTTGMCVGNSRPEEEPDIICPAPQALRPPSAGHGGWRPGRSVAECCWTKQMCAGNTDGELDIECLSPSVLRSDASLIEARDDQSCCVTYCSAVACPFPSVLRPDAANIEAGVADQVSSCCITTGMCAGNSDPIAEPEVTCSVPSIPRTPGISATMLVGRDEAQCCEVTGMCAGNSDLTLEPDVTCDVSLGQRPIRVVRIPWSAAWRDDVSSEGSFARGRTPAQCCECAQQPAPPPAAAAAAAEEDELAVSAEGYCFAVGDGYHTGEGAIDAALHAENVCTWVMVYASCLELMGCRAEGQIGEQARRSEECRACAEVRTPTTHT